MILLLNLFVLIIWDIIFFYQQRQDTENGVPNQANGAEGVGEDNVDGLFFDQLLEEDFGVVTQDAWDIWAHNYVFWIS